MLSSKGIGGNEVPLDASEAIFEIPQTEHFQHKKLTANDPVKPELVEGLNSIEADFSAIFKPEIKVDFEDANGAVKMENLQFRNLGDFGTKGITAQSSFLDWTRNRKDQYQKIIKQLKNK